MIRLLTLTLGFLMLLAGCGGKAVKTVASEEDTAAKKTLQGIWLNDDGDDVAFYVNGDTIYYPDSTSQPTCFYVQSDTLVMRGGNEVKYPIVKLVDHLLMFKNQNGDVVRLEKTDDKSYMRQFDHERLVALNQNTVIRRDSVVSFGEERYHLYVQVSPTTYKVYKTTYNDDGVEVDNVYYDNIVNINVYHGGEKLFSRDFHKKDFAGEVPASFLAQAVLSDIVFGRIDGGGIHYMAVLAMPDSSLSYQVEVIISFAGKLKVHIAGA